MRPPDNGTNDIASKPLSISFDVAVPDRFPSPMIPKKSRLIGFNAITAVLVVSLTTMGIGALQTIFTDFGNQLVYYLYGSTGLPVIVNNIFIGVLCLSLAVLFLFWMGKWEAIVPAIKESTQVLLDREPKEYFQLSHIKSDYIFRELRNRGCTVSMGVTGKGWNLDCPTIPITKASQELIRGVDFKYTNRHRFAQMAIMNVIGVVFILFYVRGTMEPVWGKYIVTGVFIFVIYCQIGMHTIGWWGALILYWLYLIIMWVFAAFTPMDYLVLLSAIGIIFFLLVMVGSVIRPNVCLNDDVWWCEYYE